MGVGLAESAGLIFIILVCFGAALLVAPVSIWKVVCVLSVVLLTYMGSLCVGLILGSIVLTRENLVFLLEYFFWFWVFLSCFYYPIDSLPKFFHPLVEINPIYHAVLLIRKLWSGAEGSYALHFYFVLLFPLSSLGIGSVLFDKIVNKWNVSGY